MVETTLKFLIGALLMGPSFTIFALNPVFSWVEERFPAHKAVATCGCGRQWISWYCLLVGLFSSLLLFPSLLATGFFAGFLPAALLGLTLARRTYISWFEMSNLWNGQTVARNCWSLPQTDDQHGGQQQQQQQQEDHCLADILQGGWQLHAALDQVTITGA